MKRTARKLIAGGAVAGAMFGTACSPDKQYGYTDPGDQALAEFAVEQAGNFWAEQGLEKGRDLHAEIAVGNTALQCGNWTVTSGSGDMRYCPSDNTIGISVAALNGLRGDDSVNAGNAIKGWVREAVGDFVQYQDPKMLANAPADTELYPEMQRTCLSGIVTWDIDKDVPLSSRETAAIRASFLHTGDFADEGHWLALGYEHGYEEMTTDRYVCIDLPEPN